MRLFACAFVNAVAIDAHADRLHIHDANRAGRQLMSDHGQKEDPRKASAPLYMSHLQGRPMVGIDGRRVEAPGIFRIAKLLL